MKSRIGLWDCVYDPYSQGSRRNIKCIQHSRELRRVTARPDNTIFKCTHFFIIDRFQINFIEIGIEMCIRKKLSPLMLYLVAMATTSRVFYVFYVGVNFGFNVSAFPEVHFSELLLFPSFFLLQKFLTLN